MEKSLFAKVSKLAHKLTKEYRQKYSCDYRTQMGIFFKLVYAMMKKKFEKAVDTMQKTVEGGRKAVTMYVKGSGLNINYYVTDRNKPPTNDLSKWKSVWKLPVINIVKLLY